MIKESDEVTLFAGDTPIQVHQTDFGDYLELKRIKDELPVIQQILTDLSEDDVMYDIGANLGVHAAFFGQTGAHVEAVEPIPETAKKARKNLRHNGASGTVHQFALSDCEQSVELALKRAHGSASLHRDQEGPLRTIRTQAITGDQFVKEFASLYPTFLKIDVEGHEKEVLRGFRDTFQRHNLTLYCEMHNTLRGPDSVSQVRDLLTEWGFIVSIIESRSEQPIIRAKKKIRN